MKEVSSGRASNAGEQLSTRRRFARQLAAHRVEVAAAFLLLAACFVATSYAYAQAPSPAECIAKCKADEKQCLHNGSSEELCEYDSKTCQKACNGSN